MNTSKKLAGQDGFSLTDLIFALAAIAIILYVVFTLYERASGNAKIDQAANVVSTIASQSQAWKAGGRMDYSGISVQALCQEDDLGKELCQDNINPWGGTYQVAVGSNPEQFTVTLDGLPSDVATSLSNKLKPSTVDQSSSSADGGTVTATYE